MIDAHDREALMAFLDTQDMTVTIEAAGVRKTFRESKCSKKVRASGRTNELHCLLDKRMIELARDILYAQGKLKI